MRMFRIAYYSIILLQLTVEISYCDDELSHYDPEISMKMLLLSAAAYDRVDPQECLSNSHPPSEAFQLRIVVTEMCDDSNNCSGYVAVSHALKAIVVAFRGSTSLGQVVKISIRTVITSKEDFIAGGRSQNYWLRGFEGLWACMEAEVKGLVSENPSYQLWVTGHSLGGAMASLASAWLAYHNVVPRKNIILYTFGMPRVGNKKYAVEHDKLVNNSWRVVNYNDIVPHLPYMINNDRPYHHGVEVFYSEEATSVYSRHRECPKNEDKECSNKFKTYSKQIHKTYFSIPVGTFWKNRCVRSKNSDNVTSKKFVFLKDRCTKYIYKNGKYIESRAKSSTASKLMILSLFASLIELISI